MKPREIEGLSGRSVTRVGIDSDCDRVTIGGPGFDFTLTGENAHLVRCPDLEQLLGRSIERVSCFNKSYVFKCAEYEVRVQFREPYPGGHVFEGLVLK